MDNEPDIWAGMVEALHGNKLPKTNEAPERAELIEKSVGAIYVNRTIRGHMDFRTVPIRLTDALLTAEKNTP